MRFFSVLFLVWILCLGSVPLFAADDEELSFVVTAGRTPEEADAVPALVTVITAEDIAASGASGLVQVLERVPGLRFTGATSGPGSESVSMRGFGENSYGRVLVLVDGNRLNNPDMKGINWNAVPLADIERIEVLDGAAGVRYGNNAVGGVINIITKKSGTTGTSVEVSAGAFAAGRVRPENREAFSHFRSTGWGNFSIAVEHAGTEGYRDRQAARTLNAVVQGTVNLTDTLSLSLRASLSDLDYQLPGGLTKAQYEDDPTDALQANYSTSPITYIPNMDDEISEHHYGGSLGIQWAPNDILELQLPLSYTGKFIESNMASAYPSPYTDRAVHTGEARPQVSATFDIAGMSLRLLGGVDLYYAYLSNDSYSDKPRTTKTLDTTTAEFSLGPYLTARFDPLENLTLTAGARFDTAFISAKKSATASASAADENKTWTAFVYDAGISFRPIEGLKVYAGGGTLFRYPFTDELASYYGTTFDYFNTGLAPEKGFNIEGGAGWTFKDIAALNGNVYYTQLEDEIGYDGSHNVNLDKSRRIGTNLSLTLSPIPYMELSGAYSFVDAIFIDGANEDSHIPLVPAHTIYGTLTGKLPLGLEFGPTLEYRSKSYQGGDFSNTQEEVEGYALYGAFLRYTLNKEDRTFSVQITVKNLLDTRHASNVYYNSFSGSAYYPEDGRSISVSARYRF
ncbi:MAG: TonB-dependent receptor [Spirochaetaceae bacterium]|jgi:iron complex outermembrane receptor protein|nr:TonB-dependent receptor [Spirochaetaceae bacterium]